MRARQRVQIDLVVAEQFQVLQARAAGQDVVGDVQHVVALVVRQMDLEQLHFRVDRLDQPDVPRQQMNRADAAAADGRVAVGHFVVNVPAANIGPRLNLASPHGKPSFDPTLASGSFLCVVWFTRNASLRVKLFKNRRRRSPKERRFDVFSSRRIRHHAGLGTSIVEVSVAGAVSGDVRKFPPDAFSPVFVLYRGPFGNERLKARIDYVLYAAIEAVIVHPALNCDESQPLNISIPERTG